MIEFDKIQFQHRAKQRLRQIYAVIYFLKKGSNIHNAPRDATKHFTQINDEYQTVQSKVSTQLGISDKEFYNFYKEGTLLSELKNRQNLRDNDILIFKNLLEDNMDISESDIGEYIQQIPEEVIADEPLAEGAIHEIFINSFERNKDARRICIQHYGAKCFICEFNFEVFYGYIGKNYIHVHHLKPLSDISQEYQINPINNLIPVCPNCHAIFHQQKPPFSINKMKDFIKKTDK